MRKLKVDWLEFEMACDLRGEESRSYLDLETGDVLMIERETADELESLLDEANPDASLEEVLARFEGSEAEKESLREAWLASGAPGSRVVSLPEKDAPDAYGEMRDFIATVRDERVRAELEQAIHGPGAFRRFRNVIHNTFREREQWFAFERERLRQRSADWLATYDVEVEWILPPPPPPQPPAREHLLQGVLKFVQRVSPLPGVTRIALIGSLTRDEPEPKDADLLVTVSDNMDLTPLASAMRKLGGHAQQRNRGTDIFLANERGAFLGRVCYWRECGPGLHARCDALHCGRRRYLHDDLSVVRLDAALIAAPPVELWPKLQARVSVPGDVETILLSALRASRPV